MQTQSIILYTSALCNLKCTYCFIDKNPILHNIDKKLAESYADSNYYLDFSKELFNKNEVNEMQFWGGEPSQGLHRITPILNDFLDYYPNLTKFMMSTNLTMPTWFEEVGGFMQVLRKRTDRNFTFILQLSLDGPERITDITRGKNTTQLFLQNFDRLAEEISNLLPPNVELKMHFKPTLSSYTISLLQTKEEVLDYFLFFDRLTDKIISLNNPQVEMNIGIPNTACPSPHTVEDGQLFANYCKLCYEITKEHQANPIFKHYKYITSFINVKCSSFNKHCNFCGGGVWSIGLLPEKKISICHNGFTDLMQAYRDWANKIDDKRSIVQELFINNAGIFSACMSLEEYKNYKDMMKYFQYADSQAAFNHLVLTIRMLAKNNQIDPKYLDEKQAEQAAFFYSRHTANCIRDNMNTSGSILIPPVGLIKLLFNGAKEYIDATEQLL